VELRRVTELLKTTQATKLAEFRAVWQAQVDMSPDTTWEASDKKRRETWPALITNTVKVFSSRSSAFRTILKSVLAARMSSLSGWANRDVADGVGLSDTLTNIVKASLKLTSVELTKTPSRASYDAYRALISNIESITTQKVLQKEMDENEAVLIRSWSQITVIAVVTVLIVLVIGFTAWFGYVCKRTHEDGEASARRAEIRLRRETEGRIAGQVAHELQPFVPQQPSAPPILQPPRLYSQ